MRSLEPASISNPRRSELVVKDFLDLPDVCVHDVRFYQSSQRQSVVNSIEETLPPDIIILV